MYKAEDAKERSHNCTVPKDAAWQRLKRLQQLKPLAAADSEAKAVEVACVGRQGNGPTSASDSKPGLSATVLESKTF